MIATTNRSFRKDPSAVLPFWEDWTAWLANEDDDTISSATVTVPAGLTKDSQSVNGGVVTAWLSGGEVGERYEVGFRIVTAGGRTDERSIQITVQDR